MGLPIPPMGKFPRRDDQVPSEGLPLPEPPTPLPEPEYLTDPVLDSDIEGISLPDTDEVMNEEFFDADLLDVEDLQEGDLSEEHPAPEKIHETEVKEDLEDLDIDALLNLYEEAAPEEPPEEEFVFERIDEDEYPHPHLSEQTASQQMQDSFTDSSPSIEDLEMSELEALIQETESQEDDLVFDSSPEESSQYEDSTLDQDDISHFLDLAGDDTETLLSEDTLPEPEETLSREVDSEDLPDMFSSLSKEDIPEESAGEVEDAFSSLKKPKKGRRRRRKKKGGSPKKKGKKISLKDNAIVSAYMWVANILYSVLTKLFTILGKVPVIGKIFRKLNSFMKVGGKKYFPLVLIILLVFIPLYFSVPKGSKITYPDGGEVQLSNFSYTGDTAKGKIENTGENIAEGEPIYSIYGYKPGINPKSWVTFTFLGSCEGEEVIIEIGETKEISQKCVPEATGLFPQTSIDFELFY